MGALEAFITSEVVEEVITEVEAKVAAAREATSEAVGTSNRGLEAKAKVLARVPELVEIEDVMGARIQERFFFFCT